MSTQFHANVRKVSDKVGEFLHSRFSSIHINGPKLDAASIQQDPHMILSTHRSHIDYFLLGYLMIEMGFKNMRFAAGDNLTKLPYVGPRFRGWGAFSVSRDVGFERNYVRNLCEEVVKMMNNHEAIIVFPEGGRSYSGATLDIKNGIIGASILTQAKDLSRPVRYVPFAVSYACPPDLPYFPLLLSGKKLRKKNNSFVKRFLGNILYFGADILAFGPMLATRKKGQYQDVYVDYGDPVVVSSVVDIEKNKSASARDEFSMHRQSMNEFGIVVNNNFKSLYRLLPVHIVGNALKRGTPLALKAIEKQIPTIIEKAQEMSRNVALVSKISNAELLQAGTEQLVKAKAISIDDGIVHVKKQNMIEYYAASLE